MNTTNATRCSSRTFRRAGDQALRVLVVDDHADAAEATALYLSVVGHEARYVTTALAAGDAATGHAPAVVLLDINMPGKSGFDVATELRALAATRDAILIAYTSDEWAAIREDAMASGFDGYFRKASELSVLLDLIASCAESEAPRAGRRRRCAPAHRARRAPVSLIAPSTARRLPASSRPAAGQAARSPGRRASRPGLPRRAGAARDFLQAL
ncbi:Response regulator MprA [Burkholderia glumae]|uniref:response regulator n=1 Tax=Burkholderia glumae TaxID=337 RepID=UPI00209430B8|nr:response regulator [Burkholderia glumae]QKM47334.1 Response regulator MprA [Burkholderia glumae]